MLDFLLFNLVEALWAIARRAWKWLYRRMTGKHKTQERIKNSTPDSE